MCTIAMEEYELMKDSKYRVYVSAVDKALKNFDYTSEWADLISALGKLNKVLMGHQKFPVIPRRIKISKRLAQCMHPALPSGVHLKALETYDIIFRCMGTNRLSHELFIYSAGLFPLLGHSAMNVRPSLLTVYETHFVPLGERLRPGLSGFLSGVLPGLEEGSDHFERTNALLEKVCEGVGSTHFYGCVWDCVACNSAIRLPAISFVSAHFNRKLATEDQPHVMGTNVDVMVSALCSAARDVSVLVQRSALDLLLVGFPMHTTQLARGDVTRLVTAALATVLRRDMSLNRRLFAWLLGTEVNLSLLSCEHPLVKRSKLDVSTPLVSLYFELYSRDTLVQAIRAALSQALGKCPHDLRPYRLLVSLLDKPDIGPIILDDILCDVFRALYLECAADPCDDATATTPVSSARPKRSQELLKSANLLFSTLEPSYIWQHCASLLANACQRSVATQGEEPVGPIGKGPPGLFEICQLTGFLLDAVALEAYLDAPSEHLPGLFLDIVSQLTSHSTELTAPQICACLRLASKVLSRVVQPEPPPPLVEPLEPPKPPPDNQSDSSDRTRANSDLTEYKNGKALKSKMKKSKTDSKIKRLSSSSDRTLADSSPVLLSVVFNKELGSGDGLRSHLSAANLRMQDLDHESLDLQLSAEEQSPVVVSIPVPSKQRTALQRCQQKYQRCFLQVVGRDVRMLNGQASRLFARLLDVKMRETECERTSKLRRLLELCIENRGDRGDSGDHGPINTLFASKSERLFEKDGEVVSLCRAADLEEPMRLACSLLVELSTFPSIRCDDDDSETGSGLPGWLQVLVTCACFLDNEPALQLTAARTLLDLMHVARETEAGLRAGEVGAAALAPLLSARHLRYLENNTSTVQTLARSLWQHLGRSGPSYQAVCVELLYRLHRATRSDAVEDVIGESLASDLPDQRMEAFHRLETVWHVGRDLPSAPGSQRTLDKSLLMMLDNLLILETSPLKLHAQSWLIHSLLRGDVSRILDPLLSILLDPSTARMSVLHVSIQQSSGEHVDEGVDDANAKIYAISSEDGNVIYHVQNTGKVNYGKTVKAKRIFAVRSLVDRDTKHFLTDCDEESRNISVFVNPFVASSDSNDEDSEEKSFDFLKGVTRLGKSADMTNEKGVKFEAARMLGSAAESSGNGLELESLKRWASDDLEMSTPAEEFFDSGPNIVESILTGILDEVILKCETNKIERLEKPTLGFHPIHQHMLLYCGVYDSNRTLYALQALRSVLVTNARMFLCCAATTGLANASSSSHLIGLLARHRKSVFGKSFAGEAVGEFGAPYRSSMYLEVVISVCLYFARSFYPNLGQMRLTPEEIAGNRQVQLSSAELLTLLTGELTLLVRGGGKGCASYIADLLARCKVNKVALHCLFSSVYCMRDQQTNSPRTFTEEIVSFNDPTPEGSPSANVKCRHQGSEHSEGFQIQLLRLLLSLLMLEHQVNALKNADGADPAGSTSMPGSTESQLRYVPGLPIPQQPMFLASVITALELQHCRHLHQHWTALVTSALPFMGPSLPNVVLKVVTQLCHNVETLSSSYLALPLSAGCCQPADYAATQLEALTALCHFCLLDSAQTFQLMAGTASLPGANPGQIFNNLVHVFMPTPLAQVLEVPGQKEKPVASDRLLVARRTILGHLPRIVASVAKLWQAVVGNADWEHRSNVLGNHRVVRHQLLEFLSPISLHHGVNFLAAVAVAWQDRKCSVDPHKVIPSPGLQQQVLVSLVAAIRVMPIDTLVQTVHQVVKQPPPVQGAAQDVSLEVSVLELFYCHVLAGPQQLAESWTSLLGLLRDGLTLTPPAQFLMLAILNQFIQRCPPLADKKDQRDLQDITAKLVESCSSIAGSCLEQTTWLRRNLAVREEDLSVTGTKIDNAATPLAQYSVQAQTVLAELLAPLLDVSYGSQEKERVVALLTTLMTNIVPYLKNHTLRNAASYRACAQLLASLSSFPYMRKAWRRDALDLLLEPAFFQMEPECLPMWRTVVDNLMTHDTTTFRDLMGKLSVSQGTGLSIFSSREAEYEVRAQLLKRLAFVVLCSETDQYQKHMPEIQERLADSLRLPQVIPSIQAQVFLCCRVLLLRMSPQHVTSLWPVIISEMVQVFLHIEQELSTDTDQFSSHIRLMSALDSSWVVNASNGLHAHGHPHWTQLQLSAAKLLDVALLLPATQLPQFQMYRWAFVGDSDSSHANNNDEDSARSSDFVPHVVRIARLMDTKYACPFVPLSVPPGHPLVTARSIQSLQELRPFFAALSTPAERSRFASLKDVEAVVERDFLERVATR